MRWRFRPSICCVKQHHQAYSVPYLTQNRSNRLCANIFNSPVSVHAVTARPKTKFARRYINVNADLKLKQSELVKEENCLKLKTGYSCKDIVDESDKLQLTSTETLNQIVGMNCWDCCVEVDLLKHILKLHKLPYTFKWWRICLCRLRLRQNKLRGSSTSLEKIVPLVDFFTLVCPGSLGSCWDARSEGSSQDLAT